MTRIFWIVGLSIALLMFGGMTVLCVIALITHRHLNIKGWTMLVFGGYTAWLMFRCLRSAILYGDPTKSLIRASSDEVQ